MSEEERKNDHNKNKQKIESAQEEEYKPILQELLAQMDANANVMSPKKPRTPRFQVTGKSASRSTDHLPLEQGKAGTGLLVSGSISGKNPSSVDVKANRNKQKSSNVAQGRRNKGIVIEEEVLEKRARPSSYNVVPLPKGTICDSDFDPSTDDDTDESDRDYNPEAKGKGHSDK